jgi:hypothetical protein
MLFCSTADPLASTGFRVIVWLTMNAVRDLWDVTTCYFLRDGFELLVAAMGWMGHNLGDHSLKVIVVLSQSCMYELSGRNICWIIENNNYTALTHARIWQIFKMLLINMKVLWHSHWLEFWGRPVYPKQDNLNNSWTLINSYHSLEFNKVFLNECPKISDTPFGFLNFFIRSEN